MFVVDSEVENNMHRNEEDSTVYECALRWCRDTPNLCKHKQLVQQILIFCIGGLQPNSGHTVTCSIGLCATCAHNMCTRAQVQDDITNVKTDQQERVEGGAIVPMHETMKPN